MRNTVLILGIIAGLWGMLVGFFGYGYTQFIEWFGEIPDVAEQVDHVKRTQLISLMGPILALVGGGLAHARPLWSGPILLASGALMYWGFEFGAFTMFPITMSLVAGMLALAAHFTKGD
ncbi:MAG: hypothetical protein IME92_09305 [Proteobacteria bacterium]|nr:hypothetical protein [Pseudomonadota bacterium]